MNPDALLNRIRLEQRGLIDIHKKLYEMEHLLPVPNPMQFAKTAESAALLSEKSTAHLRNMFFSVSNEPPIYYYPKAAEVQGIRVWADTNYLRVLLPALLPDKKKRDGCKFLLLPLQAALIQSGPLPHFSDCVICVEHIYDIISISTVTAVVCAAVALLLMNFSKNGKTVDDSRAWLKRIAITWAILNGLGFIMAYVTPFFQGGTWNP